MFVVKSLIVAALSNNKWVQWSKMGEALLFMYVYRGLRVSQRLKKYFISFKKLLN